MRTFILSFILLAAHEGRADSKTIMFAPESLNEGCATSWQMTEIDGRTLLNFQDLYLDLPSLDTAQIKHCRIAWKPLIPAGCYASSGRLKVRGHFRGNPGQTSSVRAQLRLSHDLLGQGDEGSFKNVQVEEGPFQASLELPPERFQKRWDEVKLITHLSLYVRRIKEDTGRNTARDSSTEPRLVIDAIELEPIRSQACSSVVPRKAAE